MGLMKSITRMFTGGGGVKGVIDASKDMAEVFRENSEAGAKRSFDLDSATLQQLATEFANSRDKGWFAGIVDGLNRLPRPLMVLGCFGLLVATPMYPQRMLEVFVAWSIIPAGMWAIIGTIVAFYFGGRAQIKEINFQKDLAATVALAPQVLENLKKVRELDFTTPGVASTGSDSGMTIEVVKPSDNAAVDAWRAS